MAPGLYNGRGKRGFRGEGPLTHLSVLMEISSALATSRDLVGLLATLAQRADALVPFDACHLSLRDPEHDHYATWSAERQGLNAALSHKAVPLLLGIPGWIIRTGERLILDAAMAAPPAISSPMFGLGDAQAILGLPLVGNRGETFGSLVLVSRQASPYTRDRLPILSVLAALVASSVRRTLHLAENVEGNDYLFSLARAIEAKDPYTEGHGGRVAEYAFALGRRAGLDLTQLSILYKGGFLHDVGKIGIQDSVLMKEGALTDAEYAHMKEHPEIGAQLLQAMPASDLLIPMIRHHHERWDGRGYPDGLVRDEPPLLARIVSIADAFDAMTSTRCYRPAMPVSRGLEILQEYRSTQWDPDLIAMFIEIAEKRLLETGGVRFPATELP